MPEHHPHQIRDGLTVAVHRLRPEPITFGRGGHNDVVLLDGAVSQRHLAAWVRDGQVVVEDLASRNSTWLGEARLQGITALSPGDVLRVGHVDLKVFTLSDSVPGVVPTVMLSLEDVDGRVRYPLRSDRVRIGGDPTDDIRLPDVSEPSATLMVHADGTATLGRDDDTTELSLDEPVDLFGRRFVLRELPTEVSVTLEFAAQSHPYVIRGRFDGPDGPWIEVQDPVSDTRHRVTATHPAALLWRLASRLSSDRGDCKHAEEEGWCTEREIAVGVWGRSGAHRTTKVLLCRVRKELREAGLDPWCLESKRGHVRLRAADVRLN